jgi:hypothetical protein
MGFQGIELGAGSIFLTKNRKANVWCLEKHEVFMELTCFRRINMGRIPVEMCVPQGF